MKLAVIPARGGSKRIPRKNVRDFCGRPMLVWSISAAVASGCFDKIIVSTDDEEIAAIARANGAECPFVRPSNLSDDHTPTVPVIVHAIQEMEAIEGRAVSEACCIYATAPFVTANDIRRGLSMLVETGAVFALSATSFPFPIQRAMRLLASGFVEMFEPQHALTRSQDLEEAYHDAGQFYWGSASGWRGGQPLIGPHSVAVVLPRHRVQDIDTPEDWLRAEALFEALRLSSR